MTMKNGNGQKKTEEDGKRRKKTGSGVGGGGLGSRINFTVLEKPFKQKITDVLHSI